MSQQETLKYIRLNTYVLTSSEAHVIILVERVVPPCVESSSPPNMGTPTPSSDRHRRQISAKFTTATASIACKGNTTVDYLPQHSASAYTEPKGKMERLLHGWAANHVWSNGGQISDGGREVKLTDAVEETRAQQRAQRWLLVWEIHGLQGLSGHRPLSPSPLPTLRGHASHARREMHRAVMFNQCKSCTLQSGKPVMQYYQSLVKTKIRRTNSVFGRSLHR